MAGTSRYVKLTPERAAAVVDGVRKGLSTAQAARLVGLPPRTVWRWISLGRARLAGPHADLVREVRRAEAEFLRERLSVMVLAAGPTRQVVTRTTTRQDGSTSTVVTEREVINWRAAARLLAARDPDDYGPHRLLLARLRRECNELRRQFEAFLAAHPGGRPYAPDAPDALNS